jgi:hypothetical protein
MTRRTLRLLLSRAAAARGASSAAAAPPPGAAVAVAAAPAPAPAPGGAAAVAPHRPLKPFSHYLRPYVMPARLERGVDILHDPVFNKARRARRAGARIAPQRCPH